MKQRNLCSSSLKGKLQTSELLGAKICLLLARHGGTRPRCYCSFSPGAFSVDIQGYVSQDNATYVDGKKKPRQGLESFLCLGVFA